MTEDEKKSRPEKEPEELPDKTVRPPDIEYVTNVQKQEIEKRIIRNDDDD